MNILDLVLVILFVAAIAGGVRAGFVARVATWIGLAVGVVLATWTVPTMLGLVEAGGALTRLFIGLLVLAVTVTVVTTLFQSVGHRARRRIAGSPLSRLDRAGGGVAGGLAVIVVVWFLLPAAADVPGSVAREVRSSGIIAAVRTLTPTPPDAVRALRTLIDSSRFPEVFADLEPAPQTGPPPESIPLSQDVVERATAATVNVETTGCGRRYEGSGFAVGENLVMTNAHVVAGADTVIVKRPDETVLDAVVLAFDPNRDLALLEVGGLGQRPLELASIEPGADAITVGYPGGQDTPRVAPARVEDRRTALGRDIYGAERTERQVLFLSARLQQGDSGSPVIDGNGRVVGLVFAISPDRPTTAYALDLDELESILAAPTNPGEVGACI